MVRTQRATHQATSCRISKQILILLLLSVASAEQGVSTGNTRERCQGTTGSWCSKFHEQAHQDPVVARNRSSKPCPGGCNSVGVCNLHLGVCDCPAGWTGPGCKQEQKRHCVASHHMSGFTPSKPPESLSMPGWTASRCGGTCYDDIGACFCNGTRGFRAAPPGSRPGTRPLALGRPMILNNCNPNKDDEGQPTNWANIDPELLYGDQGWCEAETKPSHTCHCVVDGQAGPNCDWPTEMVCNNQCSGHGDCWLGFCQCHPGFWGHDCAQRDPFVPLSAPAGSQPAWFNLTAKDASLGPGGVPGAAPKRPRVFVYDLPAMYNTRMVQYRVVKGACFWRSFEEHNETGYTYWTYSIESMLHEWLLQSPHRTLDPDQADLFYVPVYTSCFFHPVLGWADFPFWYGNGGPRPMHGANMLLEAKQWLQQAYPHWNRTGGKDHVWLVTHDEGSCWVPSELRSSIILSHWGRKDKHHTSGSAFQADNYSHEFIHPDYAPQGWTHIYKGHACYDPAKDLVIPSFLSPDLIGTSPLLGFPGKERSLLAFFKGDVGEHRLPHYSRGLRQKLHHLAREQDWLGQHKIHFSSRSTEHELSYTQALSSAIFCLVLPGDGFSPRAEDAVLHGCIPVVIVDNVDPVFATVLDWDSFSLRIAEAEVDKLPHILQSVPAHEIASKQQALGRIWRRFMYSDYQFFQRGLRKHKAHPKWQPDLNASLWQNPSPPHPYAGQYHEDDAFGTIMQWLHSRVSHRH